MARLRDCDTRIAAHARHLTDAVTLTGALQSEDVQTQWFRLCNVNGTLIRTRRVHEHSLKRIRERSALDLSAGWLTGATAARSARHSARRSPHPACASRSDDRARRGSHCSIATCPTAPARTLSRPIVRDQRLSLNLHHHIPGPQDSSVPAGPENARIDNGFRDYDKIRKHMLDSSETFSARGVYLLVPQNEPRHHAMHLSLAFDTQFQRRTGDMQRPVRGCHADEVRYFCIITMARFVPRNRARSGELVDIHQWARARGRASVMRARPEPPVWRCAARGASRVTLRQSPVRTGAILPARCPARAAIILQCVRVWEEYRDRRSLPRPRPPRTGEFLTPMRYRAERAWS